MAITSSHILVCRTDNIGDVVLTLPMVARLRQLHPHARISFLCRRYAAQVVRYCSDVDAVVELEEVQDDLQGYLRHSGVDTIIICQPDRPLAIAAFKSRIRHRIGNARQKLYLLFYCNRRVRFSKGLSENHEAQINFEFLKPLGDSTIPDRAQIPGLYHFSIPHDADIARRLGTAGFNLILHTKSNGHGREWPVESFLALARSLVAQHEVTLWLTGSEQEGAWLESHAADLVAMPNVRNVCGSMDLAGLTRFIHQADGLIASGTGPLHLSAAIGQRTLGLFPPTRPMHPGRWAALGPRAENLCVAAQACPGCEKQPGPTCDCMRAITPDMVLGVVQRWIAEKAATAA
ncbi:glycosyltransferase family 9 protein [Herbaspirillum sp. YR522]|uniref:glycosyltransferase family 9 protein n=1 Tax=Herbaspirillum sp. YR522 TaxID=1144342 RepID=UPI00026F654F|nr:glycosyltransferase family 9 protein [Herbaspirillum sp. YR522]EJN01783.1 ADP-heptose:LPS heptosyltransferase [Herbaspirillum sp. YR522]